MCTPKGIQPSKLSSSRFHPHAINFVWQSFGNEPRLELHSAGDAGASKVHKEA